MNLDSEMRADSSTILHAHIPHSDPPEPARPTNSTYHIHNPAGIEAQRPRSSTSDAGHIYTPAEDEVQASRSPTGGARHIRTQAEAEVRRPHASTTRRTLPTTPHLIAPPGSIALQVRRPSATELRKACAPLPWRYGRPRRATPAWTSRHPVPSTQSRSGVSRKRRSPWNLGDC